MTWEPRPLGWKGPERTEELFNERTDPADIPQDVNEVVYQIAGVDSGVNVQYRFVRTDGQWMLTEMADMST